MLTHSDKTTLSISSHGKLTRGRGSSARRRRGYGSRRGGSSHGRNGGRQRRRGRRRRVDRDAGSEFDTDEELDDLEYAEVEAEPHSVSGAIYVELEKPFEAASKSTPATAIEGSNGLMGSLARYTGTGAIGKVRLLDPSQTWSGCARMPMASNAVLATTAIEVRTGDISVTPSGVMTRHSLVDQNMIGSDFSASLATKGQVEMEEDEGLASARRVRKGGPNYTSFLLTSITYSSN
ncbi:unnamed protein product [Protopolystoma xenopodis]|uniref:Uncharacterized protein n=1 Tax=Protopolystoma xenopodis TaxID=117903 RepID=A0A448WLR1_9PLAT|nr:unnamed protein product [Protopolystoma xenopodis]